MIDSQVRSGVILPFLHLELYWIRNLFLFETGYLQYKKLILNIKISAHTLPFRLSFRHFRQWIREFVIYLIHVWCFLSIICFLNMVYVFNFFKSVNSISFNKINTVSCFIALNDVKFYKLFFYILNYIIFHNVIFQNY